MTILRRKSDPVSKSQFEYAIQLLEQREYDAPARDVVRALRECQRERDELQSENKRLDRYIEDMRPFWAQGYSNDSIAAQSAVGALSQIWRILGVKDQTSAIRTLEQVFNTNRRHP